jgi:hypothetical protein
MGWFGYLVLAVVVACILCPPKYDPAIRWKERNESKRKK